MTPGPPLPQTTLALVLGARESPGMARGEGPGAAAASALRSAAFANSAGRFRHYLCDPCGMRLPARNVLDLFDDGGSADDLCRTIADFLDARLREAAPGARPRDVLGYFVGHGEFLLAGGKSDIYHLFLRATRRDLAPQTALPMTRLLGVLRAKVPDLRCSFIIDACYSGRARGALAEAILSAEAAEKAGPMPLEGVALLCSSGADEPSRAPLGEPYTMFSGALLDVLRWGVPGRPPRPALSLGGLVGQVRARLGRKYGRAAVLPEVHAGHAGPEDAEARPLFPNAARALPWCVVLSDADQQAPPGEGLLAAAGRLRMKLTAWVSKLAEVPLAPEPTVIRAGEAVESPDRFQDAVEAVCRCPLAFFDLTEFEPAVVLLLGVRSVARRGVTVCSAGRSGGEAPAETPFFLRDISLVRHAAGPARAHPEDLLSRRARAGLEEFYRAPHAYLDLPCYDAVRAGFPAGLRPHRREYHEQVLMLCPFSAAYQAANWPAVARDLGTVLQGVMAEDPNLTDEQRLRDPSLLRVLDMSSPQLVSQTLLQAIRLTDFCVIDWTEWRPSVFFEFGVRLAANERDPVCLIEAGARAAVAGEAGPAPGAPPRLGAAARQCRGLLALFDPVTYAAEPREDPTGPYREVMHRYLALRDGPAPVPPPPPALPPRLTYATVWNNVEPADEPIADPAERFLSASAAGLLIDSTEGRAPFLYPRGHELQQRAEESGRERLLAAWHYLHYRVGPDRLRQSKERAEAYAGMGWLVAARLEESADAADRRLAAWIKSQIQDFQFGVTALMTRARAHTLAGEFDQALAALRQVIEPLEAALASLAAPSAPGPDDRRAKRNEVARQLADGYGRLGGVYRRRGDLDQALDSYRRGRTIEQDPRYGVLDSYNLTNAILVRLLLEPGSLAGDQDEIREAADTVDRQIRSERRDQWWAWADLGLLSLLCGRRERAAQAYEQFTAAGARAADYESTIAVLRQCRERLAAAAPDVAAAIDQAVASLDAAKPNPGPLPPEKSA